MTIRRETNPDLMRRIAESDAVMPFIGIADNRPDWEALATLRPVESGVVILSNGEDALALFTATADGIFQGHTMFAETCRGRRAIETGKDILAWMFDHGADVVWGSTPRENRKARWFNRQIGMRPLPTSDDEDENFEIRKEWVH